MTAEGSTGAPLRQQIAEAIHATGYDCLYDAIVGPCEGPNDHLTAADAVVSLLNLTEEWGVLDRLGVRNGYQNATADEAQGWLRPGSEDRLVKRQRIVWTGPWLPSTPPDTSSSETT